MLKMPYDPITQFKSILLKSMIIEDIERKNFSFINIVSCLPTNTSLFRENTYELANNHFLFSKISSNILLSFIGLPNIIRRRSGNQRYNTIRYSFQKSLRISMMKGNQVVVIEVF